MIWLANTYCYSLVIFLLYFTSKVRNYLISTFIYQAICVSVLMWPSSIFLCYIFSEVSIHTLLRNLQCVETSKYFSQQFQNQKPLYSKFTWKNAIRFPGHICRLSAWYSGIVYHLLITVFSMVFKFPEYTTKASTFWFHYILVSMSGNQATTKTTNNGQKWTLHSDF